MPAIETAIDPQARKYLENGAYYSLDWRFSQRLPSLFAFLAHLEASRKTDHIPTKAVAFICAQSAMQHFPFALIEHPRTETETIAEKTEILSAKLAEIRQQLGVDTPDIDPLKTITLKLRHEGDPCYFLVSGLRDFLMDATLKSILEPAVQTILRTDKRVMSRTTINPPEFDPAIQLGLIPGIVSSFADLNRFKGNPRLSGFLYYRHADTKGYAAVAISQTSTLIINSSFLLMALNVWQGFYLNIPFKVVQGNIGLPI